MSACDLVGADNVGVIPVKLIVRSVAAKNKILWHDQLFRGPALMIAVFRRNESAKSIHSPNPSNSGRYHLGMSAPLGSTPVLEPDVSPNCCVDANGVRGNVLSRTSTDRLPAL